MKETPYTRLEVQYDNDVLDNSVSTTNKLSISHTTKMARTREQRAARKAAYRARCSTSAPSTQPKSTRCLLLEIPPEIRDMIYGYVLDTIPGWSRFTPIDAEETQERLSLINKLERLKAGNQRRRTRSSPLGCEGDIRSLEGRLKRFQQPLRLGLPSVNKQLFEEVHDHMYRHVTIDVKLRTGCCFSAREMGILRSARRIRIECKYVTNEQWSQTVVVGPCSWSSQLHHALADRSNIQSFELKAWDERFYMCVQMYCADWL